MVVVIGSEMHEGAHNSNQNQNQKQEQNQTAVAGLLGWPIVTINPRSRGCLAETARIPVRNCNKRSRKDLRPSKKTQGFAGIRGH